MNLYNTLTKKVEKFVPRNQNDVKMYTCGPTVYNYAHIGNLRTYIFEDILEKTLKYVGYNVTRVMNITDVGHLTSDADTGEDKMLLGAKREGKTIYEIAEFYTDAFFKDTEKLNISKPNIIEKATDNIKQYIEMIEKLLEKGYAYAAGGNIYFDITKYKDYYLLSGKKEKDLIIGARHEVEEDRNKRNPFDFVLWFTKSKYEKQEMKWDSPWGVGYPGWHIECAGISIKNMGNFLDIHCGGVDNIFPHHTNEIAQAEAYLGHKWCNYWLHAEHLNVQFGKMSKSKGEFLTLSLLEEKGYNPLVYRFFCLQSHYRNQLEFTYESLDTALKGYVKLKSKVKALKDDGVSLTENKIDQYKEMFTKALEDDLNTANAITCLFEVLKDEEMLNSDKLYLIRDFEKVLSLGLFDIEEEMTSEEKKAIEKFIDDRSEAKKNKDYQKADEIREVLKSKGILIKDNKEGTTWELIK